MATYTSKYHLEKPDQTDIYNIDVHNANSDAIDAALAAKPDSSNLATVESTNKASRAYTVGEYLVYNGLLYRVSAAIASGGTLTPGSNITSTTTGAQLKSLNDSLITFAQFDATNVQNAYADSISTSRIHIYRKGTVGILLFNFLPSTIIPVSTTNEITICKFTDSRAYPKMNLFMTIPPQEQSSTLLLSYKTNGEISIYNTGPNPISGFCRAVIPIIFAN